MKYSPVAQSAEQMAVNHRVRGSSPRWGANMKAWSYDQAFFCFQLLPPFGNIR